MSGIDITDLVQALVGAAAILVTTLAAVAVQALRTRFRLESESRQREDESRARADVAASMLDHAASMRAAGAAPMPELLAEIVQSQMPDTVAILKATPEQLAVKAAAMLAKGG